MKFKIVCAMPEGNCDRYNDNKCCASCPESVPDKCEFTCLSVVLAQESNSSPICKYFKVEEVLPNEETKDN